ncbi:EAL domain-containing protein [Hyphomicrobium sp.]|uniref:bifunctional diguanylate cyclase/phosphodiesterase n=1 Tax=Hyphomicrobium sp. TaxID=82 RepID=UPI002BC08F33|nr:EAL domain-containing protein [Hyphomicrobium sp.]HRN87488.1 EAL domain-containing protein [Hyphomicrobium sp.]HRQ28115.1 EAL domain-containing protein [Hyphomicrobium sp.]
MRRLAVASVYTVVATALLVFGVVLWSASRIDQLSQERQFRTISSALVSSVEKIPYDQESVAIWDDAVRYAKDSFDLKWVETNLGVWLHDYFKHDRTYVIRPDGTVVYSMVDGKTVTNPKSRPDESVFDVVTALRQKMSAGALDDYELNKSRLPHVVDFAFHDNRPSLISAVPIVLESKTAAQERGSEYVLVSQRFLDASFLSDLASVHFLKGVRFSRTDDVAPNETSHPLTDRAGETIGHIVWVPEMPGWAILTDVLPVLTAGLTAISIAIVLLIAGLRRTYRELVHSEAESKHRAVHDSMTGLANRAFFNDRVGALLSERRVSGDALALMFLDLDRFKQVNDTLGHPVGDALIQEVARRIKSLIKPRDVFARMGGDEFAIIKCDDVSREDVEAFCRDVVAIVSEPFDVLGQRAAIGISIGVAMAPECGTDRSELSRKADIALYQAKNRRLGFAFYTEEMSKTLKEREALEADLRRALDTEGELNVAYQPLIAGKGLTVSGVEALVRWNHPRLGSIPPPVFIPIAEECGLIGRLGEYVLREACRTAGALNLGTIAVNVSPIQFRSPDFASRLFAILAHTGLAADRLELEITESALLDSSGTSAKVLRLLRARGVRIALDDFGTGYSSLSYLIKLEVDRIKLDRSFVQALGTCPRSSSIVRSVIAMAHAVGVSITAEGVEKPEQRDFLVSVDCDTLQGYLFSPPVSALSLVENFAIGFRRWQPAAHTPDDEEVADPRVA